MSARVPVAAAALVLLAACASLPAGRAPGAAHAGAASRELPSALLDPGAAYADAGLLVGRGSLPVVASLHSLGGAAPDSTLVLVALSFATRALTFIDDGKARRAEYDVVVEARAGGTVRARETSREIVRVTSFAETTRRDESVIFQRFVVLAPGAYAVSITLRDVEGSATAVVQGNVVIPRFDRAELAAPVVAYRATPRASRDSLPRLVASPRSLLTVGRDTAALVYFEGYAVPPDARVVVNVLDDSATRVTADTVVLRGGSTVSAGVLRLPLERLAMGRLTIAATIVGSRDTVRTPLLVSPSDALGIVTYATLVDHLRYLASPARFDALRTTPPPRQAAAWLAFLHAAGGDSTAPAADRVRAYFERIAAANARFRDQAAPGWLTDCGRVFITLGEPDRIIDDADLPGALRTHERVWVYDAYHTDLTFLDDLGFGVWRLSSESQTRFSALASTLQVP